MRKIFVSTLLFVSAICGSAKPANDSIAMTIANKNISIEEFLYTARKNGETDLADKKKLNSFVEMFKNFKLKVADAEAEGLDKTDSFKKEFDKYRAQLVGDYLSDRDSEEQILKDEYARLNELLDLTHIIFFLPRQTVTKDTIEVYKYAMDVYNRIQNGEDFDKVGAELAKTDSLHVGYEHVSKFAPMRTVKKFEDCVYGMKEGEVSKPLRTTFGIHLIKLNRKYTNPGRRSVSHILIGFKQDSITRTDDEARKLAEDVYNQAKNGTDFGVLVQKYSADKGTVPHKGKLPVFSNGQMVPEFEEASFELTNPGDISKPIKTQFGYHIIKLEKVLGIPTFDEIKGEWYRKMSQGEWNFALKKSFDDKLKKEYNFVLNKDAYAELQALCHENFPTSSKFMELAKPMNKELMRIDTIGFTQNEFAAYIQQFPFSVKTYACDFMQEIMDICVHEILSGMERRNLLKKYPEIELLANEYRDGTLLFSISNKKIWSKPSEQQKKLEEEWLKELNEKYPVTINWNAIKKAIKK